MKAKRGIVMDYRTPLKYHFKTEKGWVNDPNGLVFFKGYYHIFYQHSPNFEKPWNESMHWGHARTKDFLSFEELPVALYPDKAYDKDGCWSGTAIVKDDTLFLFYASIHDNIQSVSVAFSTDGINFTKYDRNPVITGFPADGCPDFRDPAVCYSDGNYYCVMASGNHEKKTANLLLYKSEDLFNWEYKGILCEWENSKFAECPSFMKSGEKYLLAASVCKEDSHRFSVMYGAFENEKFTPEYVGEVDKGPDQYAGQIFPDHKGRTILISWLPGWNYAGYRKKDVGCMSVPREIKLVDGKIYGYPVEEVQHLLTDNDSAVIRDENGFKIKRAGRKSVVYKGEVKDLKIIRDGYI
jgi:beta-fructofuranosidase